MVLKCLNYEILPQETILKNFTLSINNLKDVLTSDTLIVF